MALELSKTTPFGINALHWVLNKMHINRKEDVIEVQFFGYQNAADATAQVRPLQIWDKAYLLSNLPSSVITPTIALKDAVEIALITSENYWDGATIVND